MKLLSRATESCANCGGPGVPMTYGDLTPAVIWGVIRGQVRYGGATPPDVTCGMCGDWIDI